MANPKFQSGLISQPLQLNFPEPHPRSIAATGIGRDEELTGFWVSRLSHAVPPTANGFDGKGGRIVIHADAHPTRIIGEIVNSVGCGTTQFRDHKIVYAYSLRIALGTQFSAVVLEIAH